jgi:predicted  nucleic acid-binding Zn-ribbon protein
MVNKNIPGQNEGISINDTINTLKEDIENIKNGTNHGSNELVDLSTINSDIAKLKQLTAPLLTIKSDINSFKTEVGLLNNDVANFKGALSSLRGNIITLTNSLNQLSTSLNNKLSLVQMALLTEKDERISQDQIIMYKIDFIFNWLFRATSSEIMNV